MALVAAFFGGDIGTILTQLTGGAQQMMPDAGQQYQPTAEEEALADFSKQIFAGTEDVWTEIFRSMGLSMSRRGSCFTPVRQRAAAAMPMLR